MKNKQYFKQLRRYDPRFLIGIILVGIISLIFLFSFLKAFFVVVFFIGANTIFRFYKRFLPAVPLELEFITFGSLFCAIEFGISAGIAVAILGSLLADSANGTINAYNFVMTIGYIIVALVGIFISPEHFIQAGITITVIYNIIIWSVFNFLLHHDLFKNTSYSITNVIFNYFLFTIIGSFALSIV